MVTAMEKEKFFFSFKAPVVDGYYKAAGNPHERQTKTFRLRTAQRRL